MSFFLGEFEPDARDPQGRTPLHYAAALDDPALSAFFIARGAELDAQDDFGRTPLHAAAEAGGFNAARVIAGAGADIHRAGADGASPAAISLERGNEDFLEAILTPESMVSTDAAGSAVLHLASAYGNPAAVETIIAALDAAGMRVPAAAGIRDTPLDALDSAGRNPLDVAFLRPDSRDHMEIARHLILAGAASQGRIYYYFAPAARSANYDLRRADGLASMHFAAMESYAGLIEFLIERGANVNIQNQSGAAPLHEAVRRGNAEIISLLLQSDAAINAQDATGNTALHIAAPHANHAEIIELLLYSGIDPNMRDAHGDSPLHVLVTLNRSPEVVDALLSAGAVGNIGISARNARGQTPLHIAAQENRLPLIPLLLEAGSDIFAADNAGVTPFSLALQQGGAALNALIVPETARRTDSAGNTMLHVAIQIGVENQVIQRILGAGANVNARNNEGDTPLHVATRMNRAEAGEYILARGADVFHANFAGEAPLRLALTHPSGTLGWLFNPQTIEARDSMGNTMLHYVALWGMDGSIPFVVQQGLSADAANATGETPLFWAVHHDSASAVDVLLAQGANLHARDSLGNSALHSAVRWNSVNATNALLNAGINVNVHSLNGTTPLHDSVRLSNADIAAILVGRGANIEARDLGGNTPFMEAVRSRHTDAASLLAGAGADPMTRNANGDTPLHFSVSYMDFAMIDALLGMGVSIHARNTLNRTPFQIALADSPETVPALLGGNRIHASDDFGNSPLHLAINARASESMLQAIVDKGSRLAAVDSHGRIPLRLAADMGAWNLARVLANSGSDPFMPAVDEITSGEIAIASGRIGIEAVFSGMAINARDSSGNTVLHYAARVGGPDAISLLLQLGADANARNISHERPADIAARWNNHENVALLN